MTVLVVLISLGLVALFYGLVIEPGAFHVKRVEIRLKKLNSQIKILLLSDFHLYEKMPVRRLKKMQNRLRKGIDENEFDLILMAGDFIDENGGIDLLPQVLSVLKAKSGIYAVLGNHDYWQYRFKHILKVFFSPHDRILSDLPKLKTVLEEYGVRILMSEKESLRINENDIELFGLDYLNHEPQSIAKMKLFQNLDEKKFNLLLCHYPESILALDDKMDLILAGHTHGGQVTFFGKPILSRSALGRKSVRGLSKRESHLYVTRGLGVSRYFPIRFFSRPEISVLEILEEK